MFTILRWSFSHIFSMQTTSPIYRAAVFLTDLGGAVPFNNSNFNPRNEVSTSTGLTRFLPLPPRGFTVFSMSTICHSPNLILRVSEAPCYQCGSVALVHQTQLRTSPVVLCRIRIGNRQCRGLSGHIGGFER